MGYLYYELIPEAILLDNPGITKEEFVKLLDKTHSSKFREYKEDPRWDYHDPRDDIQEHHNGLEGLAQTLNLEHTKEFTEFQTPKEDENGLYIRPPMFIPGEQAEEMIERAGRKPHVIVHIKNIIHKPKEVEQLSWEKLKPGDIWEECQMGMEKGLVEKIIKEESLVEKDDDDEDPTMSGPQYRYTMIIRSIEKEYDLQKFKSIEKLMEKWPQFKVMNKYNFGQETGNFSMAKNFIWEQKEGRYYLSEKTYSRIPISGILQKGYKDLILTAEAIKHKEWKLISCKGLQHLPRFLQDSPDSRKRYENAVIDGELCTFARMKGITITEYLRLRVENLRR